MICPTTIPTTEEGVAPSAIRTSVAAPIVHSPLNFQRGIFPQCGRERSRSGGDRPTNLAYACAAIEVRVAYLAYCLPVIEEVLELRVRPDYFQNPRQQLQRI